MLFKQEEENIRWWCHAWSYIHFHEKVVLHCTCQQMTMMCIFLYLSYKLTQKNTLKKNRRYLTQQLTSVLSLGIVTWYRIHKNSIQKWRKISNISDVRRNSTTRWLKINPTVNQSPLGNFYCSAHEVTTSRTQNSRSSDLRLDSDYQLLRNRNTRGSLGEREMLWEHEL